MRVVSVMVSINTNNSALAASAKISSNAVEQTTVMQRLSTGVRVNSAKDDAAALAISTGLISQIKGMAVATRNVNDGISLAQTAESALGSVVNMLQRMRELAVQSESGTYTDVNRHSMQLEFANNIAEIESIFQTTNFNGIKLFDGSAAGLHIQSGVNSNDTNIIDLAREDVQDLLSIFAGKKSVKTKSTYAKIMDIVNAIVPAADWKIPLYQMTDFIPNGGHRLVTQDQVGISPNGSTIAGAFRMWGEDDPISGYFNSINRTYNTGLPISVYTGGNDITIKNNALIWGGNHYGIYNIITGSKSFDYPFSLQPTHFSSDCHDASVVANPIYSLPNAISQDETTFIGRYLDQTTGNITSAYSKNGQNTLIGALTTTPVNGMLSTPTAVDFFGNNIAGESFTDNGAIHAYSYNIDKNKMIDIGTLGGDYSVATGISADGTTIVGNSNLINEGPWTSTIIHTTHGFIYKDGVMKDIGTLGGDRSQITGVSGDGSVVVGSAQLAGGTWHAFVYKNGVMTDIHDTTTDVGLGGWGESACTGISVDGTHIVGTIANHYGAPDATPFIYQIPPDPPPPPPPLPPLINVKTQNDANVASDVIDYAIGSITNTRTYLGAMQNSLQAVIDNLTSSGTNAQQANGRQIDTDYAETTTQLSRNQIISQAATAMLAQANQSSQLVLQLLKP